MRYLLFSDAQVKPDGEFSKPTPSGLTTNLEIHLNSCKWVAEQIRKYRPDVVVNLGDSVDNPFSMDAATITVMYEGEKYIADTCKEFGLHLYEIIGNHDIANPEAGIHAIPYFRGNVIDRPGLVRDDLAMYPWGSEDALREFVQQHRHPSIICAHVDIKGAWLAGNKFNEDGFDPSTLAPGMMMFCGHYHHYQKISDQCILVGSLYSSSFSDEAPCHKGIVIYDSETSSITKIPNPYSPLYVTLDMIGKNRDQIDAEWKSKVSGHDHSNVYLRVKADHSQSNLVNQYTSLSTFSRIVYIYNKFKTEKKLEVNLSTNPKIAMSKYVESKYDNTIDKSKLLSLLDDICK